jgi:hypothetical protein
MSDETEDGLTAKVDENIGEMIGKAAPLSIRALTEVRTDDGDGC